MADKTQDGWHLWQQLEEAVEGGDATAVATLIRAGADPNAVEDCNDPTMLMRAAERGQLDVVRALVEGGANVNSEADDLDLARRFGEKAAEIVPGVSALLYAGLMGHREIYEFLHGFTESKLRRRVEQILKSIERSKKPRSNNCGAKALNDAVQRGDLESVRASLAAGANVNAQTRGGGTALTTAAALGHGNIVSYLLEKGADVGIATDEGMTAIHCAKEPGIIRELVRRGANPNCQARYGQRPLHFACGRRHDQSHVRCLLELGAEVNASNDDGETPILLAAQFASSEVVSLLLAAGADPTAADEHGKTPFELACSRGDGAIALAVIDLLRQAGGAPSGARDLIEAAAVGDGDKIQTMFAQGQDINARDSPRTDFRLGQTALHAAAAAGQVDAAGALIAAGADVEATTLEFGESKRNRWTPLRMAAAAGRLPIIALLAGAGADPEAGAMHAVEKTPLMEAAERGDLPTVKALVSAGANVRRTCWGDTAVDLAARAGHAMIADFLAPLA